MQSYCDFTSEAGKAWTLIESFSLLNKGIYIYHAFPRNENNFKLDDFNHIHYDMKMLGLFLRVF